MYPLQVEASALSLVHVDVQLQPDASVLQLSIGVEAPPTGSTVQSNAMSSGGASSTASINGAG
jgi:hypothetical protein